MSGALLRIGAPVVFLVITFLVVFGVLPSGGDSVKQRRPEDGSPNHQT
jgi:hypothetical protein